MMRAIRKPGALLPVNQVSHQRYKHHTRDVSGAETKRLSLRDLPTYCLPPRFTRKLRVQSVFSVIGGKTGGPARAGVNQALSPRNSHQVAKCERQCVKFHRFRYPLVSQTRGGGELVSVALAPHRRVIILTLSAIFRGAIARSVTRDQYDRVGTSRDQFERCVKKHFNKLESFTFLLPVDAKERYEAYTFYSYKKRHE